MIAIRAADDCGSLHVTPRTTHETGLAVRHAAAAAFAERLRPMVVEMCGRGLSLRQIAATLTEQGIRTSQDGRWAAGMVQRILGAQNG